MTFVIKTCMKDNSAFCCCSVKHININDARHALPAFYRLPHSLLLLLFFHYSQIQSYLIHSSLLPLFFASRSHFCICNIPQQTHIATPTRWPPSFPPSLAPSFPPSPFPLPPFLYFPHNFVALSPTSPSRHALTDASEPTFEINTGTRPP